MLAQGVIEDQHRIGLGTTDCLGLLEQICEPTVIDTLLEPGRPREETRQIGFVSTLKHTAGDVRQALVIENAQAWQVMLKMAKLTPLLKEIVQDARVGGHDGSRS